MSASSSVGVPRFDASMVTLLFRFWIGTPVLVVVGIVGTSGQSG
jgi:hypothetical protein